MNKTSLLSMVMAVAVGHTAAAADIPRTAWGDPDLRGTYTSDNSIGVPFQRPPQYGEREFLNDDEYAKRVDANEVQVEKDLNALPESQFSPDDPAAINAILNNMSDLKRSILRRL